MFTTTSQTFTQPLLMLRGAMFFPPNVLKARVTLDLSERRSSGRDGEPFRDKRVYAGEEQHIVKKKRQDADRKQIKESKRDQSGRTEAKKIQRIKEGQFNNPSLLWWNLT